MRWRVVLTESEELTGAAPVCPEATKPGGPHDLAARYGYDEPDLDEVGVYDCCPPPQLECGTERGAAAVVRALTDADLEVI